MKRINLKRFGIVRNEMRDFSDDGTYFFGYDIQGCNHIYITRAYCQDNIYLNGRPEGNLGYCDYGRLPHYQAIGKLNGVVRSEVTEEDVKQFVEACYEFNNEYEQRLKELKN